MEDTASISLVDNTAPSQHLSSGDLESLRRTSTVARQSSRSSRLNLVSVSGQLAKRKYAKWQPDRLGVTSDNETSPSRESSRARGSISAGSTGGPPARQPSHQDSGLGFRESETIDFAPTRTQSHTNATTHSTTTNGHPPPSDEKKPVSELDILYENQRGSFVFGIPLYSQGSLLNLDPSPWMTQDRRESPVNITNAQLPDPSWEWSWRTWYVDMSGDVDEQGWQYSFSFSSSQWHGTHPWFHSWVRRRRWVRLRHKAPERRVRGRSEFEQAHMLTEDYFTIHSHKVRSRDQSTTGLSRVESGFLNRVDTKVDEEVHLEEIGDIPTLMHALKLCSIDREKIDALRKFVEEGGEELYYLNDKITEIMSMFVFQASRWHFVTYLVGMIQQLSQLIMDSDDKESDRMQRKKDNLIRAVESAKQHVTGPDFFADSHGESGGELLGLTPLSQHKYLLSKRAQATGEPLIVMKGKEIKGIPKAAEIGGSPESVTACPSRGDNFRSLAARSSSTASANTIPLHATGATGAFLPMFSSGRPCLRRRLSVVLDNVTAGSDEPLLFLYPRWAASALQCHQTASLTTTAASANRSRTSNRTFPSVAPPCAPSISVRRQSSRWFSPNAAGKDGDGSSTEVPLAANETINSSEQHIDNAKAGSSPAKQAEPTIEPKRPVGLFADIETDTPARGPITWKSRRRNRHRPSSRPLAAPTRDVTTQKANSIARLSVRDRKKLRYGAYIKGRSKNSEKLSYYPIGGWDSMKDILERQAQDPRVAARRSAKHKELQVPEETIGMMSGMTDTAIAENIFYINVRNGCRVQILHPRDGDGLHRKVILSGSERVMELVEDRIKRVQAQQEIGDPLVEISKPLFPVLSSMETMRRNKLPVPMIRGVWIESKSDRMSYQELLDLGSSIGTVKEFAERIQDLIRACELPSGERTGSKPQPAQRDQTVRRILRLFRQDSNKEYFSSAALNQALAFLCDQELLKAARAVFLRAEHVATADTYNIFLRTAARRQDLKTFRRFLISMDRASIRPTPETWLVLLGAVVTPKAKASLIAHLVQKGYMAETRVTRTALQLTIQDSLLVHLENGQMPLPAGGDFTAANILLKFCLTNQLPLGSNQLTLLLTMCRKDVFSAVDYLLPLLRQSNFQLSRQNMDFFFRIAYKSEKYNICRVLWRYACVYGLVTHRMKEIVLSSLCRNVSYHHYANDFKQGWQLYAGKVIVGLELHFPRGPVWPKDITDLIPSRFSNRPLDFLSSGFKAQGTERDLQHRVAWMLIHRDLGLLGKSRYAPVRTLSVMLESAAILDADWGRQPRSLDWFLDNAIHVPIKRLPSEDRQPLSSTPLSSPHDLASLELYSAKSALRV
ncbi:hypothetical protein N7481_004257 [Penicillium waksmanii]|uniref:uncharacterized protein n=1 Tax=Penicillium waksmanii TaxID=69791 RepID=UPI002549159D|nr:uncharacterized protein N7481_004257 [Penicillium waksmanii]KAJ5989047.1 hypothetical protein N7481_004257 [Penicillium waksmanii]